MDVGDDADGAAEAARCGSLSCASYFRLSTVNLQQLYNVVSKRADPARDPRHPLIHCTST